MKITVENSLCIINYWTNDCKQLLVLLITIPSTVTEVSFPLMVVC